MKNFRWILLGGLLMTAPHFAQAQPAAPQPMTAPPMSDERGGSSVGGSSVGGAATDAGGISNGATTTTTTTTTGIAPDATGGTDPMTADGSTFGDGSSSTMPNTGGEPMIAVLAGLSIAGAALVMRRKVTA